MNAVTETAAAEPVSGVEISLPLAKLKKSPRNARKVPHGEAAIEALAASIQHKGLIQNLVVEPETKDDGTPTGYYLVTAGEGRRLAMLVRAKRKQIKKSEPVRCWLDTANDPSEISLDENVSYLGRVTKAHIVEAVAEGVSEDAARRIADMKKPDMAQAAEQLLAGTGWLPAVLRTPKAEAEQPATVEAEATERQDADEQDAYAVAAE